MIQILHETKRCYFIFQKQRHRCLTNSLFNNLFIIVINNIVNIEMAVHALMQYVQNHVSGLASCLRAFVPSCLCLLLNFLFLRALRAFIFLFVPGFFCLPYIPSFFHVPLIFYVPYVPSFFTCFTRRTNLHFFIYLTCLHSF